MSGLAWSNWFWRDWDSDPGLRLCSFAAQGLWMRMLCIAAASQRPGYVMVADRACSTEDIARITGGSVDEVSQLISELEKGGVFSRDAERVIFCRRMVRETERISEFREHGKRGGRPRKLLNGHAEKDKARVSKKQTLPLALARTPDGDGDGGISSRRKKGSEKVSVEAQFETFWKAYPRREDKGHARTAYTRSLKATPADVILAAAVRYAARRSGEDKKYTALPSTWLNGERWNDEVGPAGNGVLPFAAPGFG